MQKKNLPFDPPGGEDPANQGGGVGVPVKGDSSNSNSFGSDSPTLIDVPGASTGPKTPPTPIDPDATQIDVHVPARSTPAKSSMGSRFGVAPILRHGDVFGGRYEILQLLGEGGMGAVYKARDRELDRPVALKLIRPELAANPSILARFKQELLLARQVTHQECHPHLRSG